MPTSAFSTDLYQLTMMAGYFTRGMLPARATFELFVRRLPRHRVFLVAAVSIRRSTISSRWSFRLTR